MMRAGAGLSMAVLASASSASAAAEPPRDDTVTMLIPGYLYGAMNGTSPARAHGAEISLVHIFDPKNWFGVGLLAQLQSYDGTHARTALAGEAMWGPFGLELGWAMRGAAGTHGTQHGVHFAPYFSLGLVSFAWRFTLPVGRDTEGHGFEHGFVLALKLPIPVHNWQNMGHLYPAPVSVGGRPLRDANRDVLLPSVGERKAASRPRDRDRWIAEARMEHASVESFLWLADDLDAHGAPADLVARASIAAEEERRHAALCLGFAGGGVTLRSRVRRSTRRRPDARRLADDAFCDGVLGEGRAARDLAAEAARTHDATRARALASIAIDEASHARLSADVLAWLATL